ncbi:transglutaminase domain-containing protein [Gorillibacterium sp. CAU 1737]|uniref:transglutaminase domain-containing protein n=1 Tax=Gorillibacterium sp. CAU 1737 TaxID=3140362 RepID=UPI00325FF5E9
MSEWLQTLWDGGNLVTVILVLIILFSALAGAARGATSSARQLVRFGVDTAMTVLAILLSWKAAEVLSPRLEEWLTNRAIRIPDRALGAVEQLYYTVVTGIRDFSLMRAALLFFLAYLIIRSLLGSITFFLGLGFLRGKRGGNEDRGLASISSLTGAVLGAITGSGRALLLIAMLFVYTSLFPQTGFASTIRDSKLYEEGTKRIVQPLAGDWLTTRLPVFTESVKDELSRVMERRYEVLDANVPDDIVLAAKKVTEGAATEEKKARALYEWVGTRVRYDWDKYNLYMDQRIWKEQTPRDTFRTRTGVCIDYSRLYAVMARSVGLEVKVVTGLGADGTGGYGPHAWNEVWLPEEGWVPLDSTWVSSGGNWFNPPNFDETHIPDKLT